MITGNVDVPVRLKLYGMIMTINAKDTQDMYYHFHIVKK